MKTGKCPDADNIRPEHLKAGGLPLFKALAVRFSRYLNEKKTPAAWKNSRTILLMKKGNPENLSNYRPITLLSQIYKTFSRVVLNGITKDLDVFISREQAGFRRGYSTVDHIHTVRQLVEQRVPDTSVPCIRRLQSFDSVERNAVLNALDKCGVNPNDVDLLREMTTGCSMKIKLFSDPCYINICNGIRQGDTIFPKSFAVTLGTLFSELGWDGGIRVNGERLTHLLFADNCVLFGHSGFELQDKLLQLQIESKKIGLEMNLSKTIWMRNSLCRRSRINTEGQIMEEVGSYVYLGHQLSFTDNIVGECSRRRNAAWSSFNRIRTLLFDANLPMKIKAELFHSTIVPILLYGAECWPINKAVEDKLSVTQRSMERRIRKISLRDHVTSVEILPRTGFTDVVQEMFKRKRECAGHVAHIRDNRWTSRLICWDPLDRKRPRGRLKTRWADPMVKVFGRRWMQRAQDQKSWSEVDLRGWRMPRGRVGSR
ncbi:Putative uncharacterized transposon-derived protein F52C9.6, partial [Toxocara canis]